MVLTDAFTSDTAVFFDTDEHAQTVTYAGSEIAAVVDYGERLGDVGGGKRTEARLFIKVSDVAEPAYRDVVVIGSNTFYVQNRIAGDGYIWELEIARDERPELR